MSDDKRLGAPSPAGGLRPEWISRRPLGKARSRGWTYTMSRIYQLVSLFSNSFSLPIRILAWASVSLPEAFSDLPRQTLMFLEPVAPRHPFQTLVPAVPYYIIVTGEGGWPHCNPGAPSRQSRCLHPSLCPTTPDMSYVSNRVWWIIKFNKEWM